MLSWLDEELPADVEAVETTGLEPVGIDSNALDIAALEPTELELSETAELEPVGSDPNAVDVAALEPTELELSVLETAEPEPSMLDPEALEVIELREEPTPWLGPCEPATGPAIADSPADPDDASEGVNDVPLLPQPISMDTIAIASEAMPLGVFDRSAITLSSFAILLELVGARDADMHHRVRAHRIPPANNGKPAVRTLLESANPRSTRER